jgi:hypothetical protein
MIGLNLYSLPFKGRVRVGMGCFGFNQTLLTIPHPPASGSTETPKEEEYPNT